MKLINAVRKNLPKPLSQTERAIGPRRSQPPSDDPNDPATRRWQERQVARENQIAWVHYLAEQGLSQRAIARQTGFHRCTVRKWLRRDRPDVAVEELPKMLAEPTPPSPKPSATKRAKIRQAQELAGQGLSYSEIARQLGVHRVTISKWVTEELPPEAEEATLSPPAPQLPPPLAPWQNWEQVRQVREMLQEHRFVLLKRPENLDDQEQALLVTLLGSPVGAELQIGRDFLVDWYRLWRDETGQRRTFAQAEVLYQAWRMNETYRAVPILHRLQQRVTMAKFEQMSQFLHQPEWEATNNGAERAGRAFRHRQAPHFNLREKDTIAASITVTACLQKEAATVTSMAPLHTCQRGRKQQSQRSIPVAMFEKAAVVGVPAYA
jgi:transposase